MSSDNPKPSLGDRLRSIREAQGLSLRAIERQTGVNTGYLSQLERNEIAQPTPGVLAKLAEAYGEPLGILMEWAGYIERAPDDLNPNRERALSYIPDDINEDELQALKAVLDVLRSNRPTANAVVRPHRSDLILSDADKASVRRSARAVLKELDAERSSEAVDLDAALEVARLVKAGAIELDDREKSKLREKFGSLVDLAFARLQGVIHFDSNEVFINQELHELRRRFVMAHEIGHGVMEDHRLAYGAFLDDRQRLAPDFADRLECQANRFSIELLGKGDLLRREFDDSTPSARQLTYVSQKLAISLQAVARHVAEESKNCFAIAIAWRSQGGQGPLYVDGHKLWMTKSFEQKFHWQADTYPRSEVNETLRTVCRGEEVEPFEAIDARGRKVDVSVDDLDARYSTIAMLVPGRSALKFSSFRKVKIPAKLS